VSGLVHSTDAPVSASRDGRLAMWNDGRVRGDVVPRDDRAWPRSSLVVSVGLALAAVGSGVGLAFGAAGRGFLATALVTVGFVVAFGFGLAVSVPVMRHWIAGHSVPGRLYLLQWAGLIVGFLVLVWLDVLVGWAMIAGLVGGLLVANVWGIRTARANRQLVDQAEAALAEVDATASPDAMGVAALDAEARQDAPVGKVLRDNMALERRRSIAWLVAGAVALAACGLLDAPDHVTIVVVLAGGLAFLWVLRRLWAAWLALRDFTKAATSPRRAFVVLLHDPAPRTIRPLLGIWSDAPVLRDGRLPKPERVYRCDEELDALECHQGSVVVHEAWVDTGPRRSAKPRWVAADAGIALPHRRAILGAWYMSNRISGERPEQPRRLTLQPPHPDNDVIVDLGRNVGSFPAALAGRLAALTAFGLLVYWLN
jgi:hypothetical protein